MIWVIDFGSQYTQLLVRKIRGLGHHAVLMTVKEGKEKLLQGNRPQAIALSGGPHSVFLDEEDYSAFFEAHVPVLGICYGMQLMMSHLGGKVEEGKSGEYGETKVALAHPSFKDLFKGHDVEKNFCSTGHDTIVWMSHRDHCSQIPEGFSPLLVSEKKMLAAVIDDKRKFLGLQFHPEVTHTNCGEDLLKWVFQSFWKLEKSWDQKWMLQEIQENLFSLFGEKTSGKILCAFSGGVDSLVAAFTVHQLYPGEVVAICVDHGLLRPQDMNHLKMLQEKVPFPLHIVQAEQDFKTQLAGESSSEGKRKIIGKVFIDVFDREVHRLEKEHGFTFKYLLQGTLYPDVIESLSPHKEGGKSSTIKSHHNVGGLPEMKLTLMEPFRLLFKDEVRQLGEFLGLNKEWLYRHPFPGPGLGIRVLGDLSVDDWSGVRKVAQADQILFEELHACDLYSQVWQSLTVHLPILTVGVKGDQRVDETVIVLRLVESIDGMTATWSYLPEGFLRKVSNRITNEVRGVTRVVLDITSKPPGTIEWE